VPAAANALLVHGCAARRHLRDVFGAPLDLFHADAVQAMRY
jgi:hypothetical protein